MTPRTALAITLMGVFAATQGGAVRADISSRPVPISPGDLCHRCERVLTDPFIGAETVGEPGLGAAKFRTIRCMLAHMRETSPDIRSIFVVDSQTGKLVNVDQAVFVPVRIDTYTGEAKYGVGERDFVAFRSVKAAEHFAADNGVTTMSWPAVVFAAASLPERPLELRR